MMRPTLGGWECGSRAQGLSQRGGESVAIDSNADVANRQIFVYWPAGKQVAQMDVTERSVQLIFGGADRKKLWVLAHQLCRWLCGLFSSRLNFLVQNESRFADAYATLSVGFAFEEQS